MSTQHTAARKRKRPQADPQPPPATPRKREGVRSTPSAPQEIPHKKAGKTGQGASAGVQRPSKSAPLSHKKADKNVQRGAGSAQPAETAPTRRGARATAQAPVGEAPARARGRRGQAGADAPPHGGIAALNVQRMKLTELEPHPRNTEIRKHPAEGDAKWEVLKESLRHDYFDPLVWNVRNGFLVSGHLRLKIMQSLGYTQADVVKVSYDEATHLARMLAANRLLGDDDTEGQKSFLLDLGATKGFNFALAGFTLGEVRGLAPAINLATPSAWDDGTGVNDIVENSTGGVCSLVLRYPQSADPDVRRIVAGVEMAELGVEIADND